jgi:hypothetical protein
VPSILEHITVLTLYTLPEDAALLTMLAALVVNVAVAVWPLIVLTFTILGFAIFCS